MNLRELSERLGLSHTTVSRALGGYPDVSTATRARVVEAAERLGYRPDRRARALATGQSRSVSCLIRLDDNDDSQCRLLWHDCLIVAATTFSEANYRTVVTTYRDSPGASAIATQ